MRYEIEIDVEDLGISTEDLISLAEDNGDRLYDQDDLDYRVEEEVANALEDAKDTIKTLEEEIAKTKSVDVEAIAIFVQTALRVEAIGIADCIRRGDYGA
jgi:hypothetical protein